MVKIDVKDKKILYHLDLDSRQSFNSIGKKVCLTKDNVTYRVKRLQEQGVIVNFRTHMFFQIFNYLYVRTYFKLQNTNPQLKKEIIDYFCSNDDIIYVGSLEGSYDLIVNSPVKNPLRLNAFFETSHLKYGDYIAEEASAIFLVSSWYGLSFLLDEKIEKRDVIRGTDERELPKLFSQFNPIKIDNIDFKILKILSDNARIPTTEIAKQINSTITVVHHRIKKLIESKIISGFSVTLDLGKIGYRFYHVDINLKKFTNRYNIIDYIKKNPYLYCIEKVIGHGADLELEFFLENVEHLHNIMEDLSSKFPESIKNFKYFSYLKVHKYNMMPYIEAISPHFSITKSLEDVKIITNF